MRIGDLRRRVSVQQRSATLDAWGQQALTWTDLLSGVPAAIESLFGREALWAQQVQSSVTHKVTVRWNVLFSDPKQVNAWRVVYVDGSTTRYLNIQTCVIVDERHRWVELRCVEGLNDGQ